MRMRYLILAFAALACVGGLVAEPQYNAVSATVTSQTITFIKPAYSVVLCNDGAGIAYFRLFNETETPAAAAATHAAIPVGTCIEFTKGPTDAAYYRWAAILSASTSTVRVYSN